MVSQKINGRHSEAIDQGIKMLLDEETRLVELLCSSIVSGTRMNGNDYNELSNVQKDIKLLASYASHRGLLAKANS